MADVLNCANPTLQGTVDISVDASDALAGLDGEPVVTVSLTSDSSQTLPVTYVDESPAGTFNYTISVDSTTTNGSWTIDVVATDLAGNSASVQGTLCVNKNQITGTVEFDTLNSTDTYTFDRDVTFVATDASDAVLASWTPTIAFTNPANGVASATYLLTNVPDATASLSAKTDLSLRRKQSVTFDSENQSVVDFTGANDLLGGDLDGTNSVNILDYSILKVNWLQNSANADINGDGLVKTFDYLLMKANWFVVGDDQ
jgi:hypothetical protein